MTNQISRKWNRVKFEDVADFNIATAGKNYKYTEIEYVDISSVETGILNGTTKYDYTQAPGRAKRIVKSGDTIVANVRPNRRSFYYFKNPADNLIVSTGFTVITPKEDSLNKRYAYYLISNQAFTDYLINHAKGAAYPAVDTEIFKKAQVLIPDLQTQKQIADVLSAYDDLIENNNRRIKILEETAQKIYKEWFVNFRLPGYEKIKMVDSGTEFGVIPEGWEVKNLGSEIELAYGKALKEENRVQGGILVCGSGGVVGTHNEKLVSGPGIVVGRKGNAGAVFWVHKDFFPIDTAFFVQTKLPFEFALYLLKSQNFILGDAAVPGLNREQAYRNPTLFPTNNLIEDFADRVKPLRNLADMLGDENLNLKKSRDLLIPQLVSGKLEIK